MTSSALNPAVWPAPSNVKAFVTTRVGGVSQSPFNSFNLAQHVEDNPAEVDKNRARLVEQLNLDANKTLAPLVWGTQVHGIDVVTLPMAENLPASEIEADAFYTQTPNQPCLVMTADCLPVVFCNKKGDEVAVAHAGWRGLANGVLEQTVATFDAPASDILAWLGPAIGADQFEVGAEVKEAFLSYFESDEISAKIEKAFTPKPDSNPIPPHAKDKKQKYMADIFALARIRLNAVGVNAIYGGGECTVTQADQYYSYRRDGKTGRMATLVWFESLV